jgi:hypothetical protein
MAEGTAEDFDYIYQPTPIRIGDETANSAVHRQSSLRQSYWEPCLATMPGKKLHVPMMLGIGSSSRREIGVAQHDGEVPK